MDFRTLHNDSRSYARRGVVTLKRGEIKTPAFMPVGTYGTVRGLGVHELEETGADITLGNTYHLSIRPGLETIQKLGGLHGFTGWKKPILTDSGGFQVFSLSTYRKITDERAEFRNPLNGDLLTFTPESVLELQEGWGSDIAMVFDECPPATAKTEEIDDAVRRTSLWARRSIEAWSQRDTSLFCINQGGCDLELRKKSLRELLQIENETQRSWSGLAIGGLSVGEGKPEFVQTLHGLRGMLPTERPRYLMGVGSPKDIVFAVACGIDMFDCVIPSRNGRHGVVMTSQGKLNLFNSAHIQDDGPIDPECPCTACRRYTRGLLRHLFNVGDTLAGRLATLHNVTYFVRLMEKIRTAISEDRFADFAQEFLSSADQVFLGRERKFSDYPTIATVPTAATT